MFAAHLAAGLAAKSADAKVPAWATLTGAFLPDLIWIGLSAVGVEQANDTVFFDGWSHSVVSIGLQAMLFPLLFYRLGRPAMLWIGAAVLSHLLLDGPIHPMPLELWPHSGLTLANPTWAWGQAPFALGKSNYWWIQLVITLLLLGVYWIKETRRGQAVGLVAASCLIVLWAHLVF